MSGIKATSQNTEQTINPYQVLSAEECEIITRIGLKGTLMDNTDDSSITTNSLSEVFEAAGEMFRQINNINKLNLKRKQEQTKPTLIEYIGTSKIAVFSLYVMAAVFSDANVLYNQLLQTNKNIATDKPIRKSIADSLYVWAVQITALPVKAVFSVGMFIDCIMVLALTSIPVSIQALRGKFNNKDSPELSELFHMCIGFIIKPFTYDILNPYILFKDYVPVVSWVVGARKLFSGYTKINAQLENKSANTSSVASTATATDASEKSHSIKPRFSIVERIKNFNMAITNKFILPRRKASSGNLAAEYVTNNKEYMQLISQTYSDIGLNKAINDYINGESNSSLVLNREIAIRFLEPKSSYTNDIKLLSSIAKLSKDPLLKILADTYSHIGSKILTEIFQDRKLKNTIIDYLSNPNATTLNQLQEAVNISYQKNMLSTSTHYLPAHKNELQIIYDKIALATGIDHLHDKHNVLSRTSDIKFSHTFSKPIPKFDYSELIDILKQEYSKNPKITKFEAFKFKYKGEHRLSHDIYVFNINGIPNFIKKGQFVGEGNSAEVYKGINIESQHEELALKIFKDAEKIESIQKEADRFNHYYLDEGEKAYSNEHAILMPFFAGNIEINDDRLIQQHKDETKNDIIINDGPPRKEVNSEATQKSGTFISIKGAEDEEANIKFANQMGNLTDTYFDKYRTIKMLKKINETNMNHSPRLTVNQAVNDYAAKYAELNDKKNEEFLKELKSLIAKYRTISEPANVGKQPIHTSKQNDDQKITSNLDMEQINFLIECSKAICKSVDKFDSLGLVPLDFKLDNAKLNRDPETNEIKASPIDFGSVAELEKEQATIVDSATLLHGTLDYATPYNRNVYESILNNLDIYLASTKVQAMKHLFDNESPDFQAYITNNLPPEDKNKLDKILANPFKLDNYVYSSKTAAYALGHALEKHIAKTLNLKPIDDFDNISNKYEYSNDIKGNKDYKALGLLNNLLGIINDLKDDALSRATAADAIEKLNALTQRPKMHI